MFFRSETKTVLNSIKTFDVVAKLLNLKLSVNIYMKRFFMIV